MVEWGNDELTNFFDTAHKNQKGNRINFPYEYDITFKINDCFVRVGNNLINVNPVIIGTLIARCQYAYKAAVGLALAGQIVESFVMMRSVLEYAGYAILIHKNPDLETVFLNRHVTEAEMRLQRETFKIGNVNIELEKLDKKLAENFKLFYQRAIDFGAHPNPYAMFSAMKVDRGEDETSIMNIGLTNDNLALRHTLKSVSQVGLTSLYIFQHAFKAKFEILGVREVMDSLRNTGL